MFETNVLTSKTRQCLTNIQNSRQQTTTPQGTSVSTHERSANQARHSLQLSSLRRIIFRRYRGCQKEITEVNGVRTAVYETSSKCTSSYEKKAFVPSEERPKLCDKIRECQVYRHDTQLLYLQTEELQVTSVAPSPALIISECPRLPKQWPAFPRSCMMSRQANRCALHQL
jgi:hypothetical protein